MVTQNNVLPKSRGYDTAEGWIFSDCNIKNFHSHLAKKCKLHDNFTGSSSWKKCPNSTKSLLQIYVNPVFKWYWRCLLLLYTWRQNKCLYYYKWVDLKPFEINHLYVLFTHSAMQTCTTTPRGGYILFTCCHWTRQHRVWWGSGWGQQDFPWPGFPCTHSPGAAACQAETMTVLMQLILPSTRCQWHSSDCTCWWQPCQELPAILAPPGFVPLAISERCS